MLTWKSNKEYPNDDEHEVFVIAKAYNFCGMLFYQNDNFDNDPNFEPYVENDEGYFSIPWSKIDGWMSYNDLITDIAPEMNNKETIKKAQEDRRKEEYEKEQKEIEEAFKDFDKTKEYNIVVLEVQPESYSELVYPKIYEFTNKKVDEFIKNEYEKKIGFNLTINNYHTYMSVNVNNLMDYNKNNNSFNYEYIVSDTKSIKELKLIVIKNYIDKLLDRISNRENDIRIYKDFIQKLKGLLNE